MTKKKKRICIGYGEFSTKCVNKAGSPWSDHWCERCDKIRIDTVSKSFEKIVARLEVLSVRSRG